MNEKRINGWLIFWAVLISINFVSYAHSIMIGDMLTGILSAFMILYCSIGFWRNFNKASE
jgi:hypothetical protein